MTYVSNYDSLVFPYRNVFVLNTEQEGEADWVFDEDEVMGNIIGAAPDSSNVDRNIDLAEVT